MGKEIVKKELRIRGYHKTDDEVGELERFRRENFRLKRQVEEQNRMVELLKSKGIREDVRLGKVYFESKYQTIQYFHEEKGYGVSAG